MIISRVIKQFVYHGLSFRLLNSEIGNDHFKSNKTIRISWIEFSSP